MAGFRKDKTGAAQTAANASAVLVSAFADKFSGFGAAVEAFNDLRTSLFADLSEVVDADNKLFEEVDKATPSKSSGSSSGSSYRSKGKTGGGGSKRSGGKSSITLEDALSMELNYGAFEGETLATVLGLEVDVCDDQYGYGDGERDGRDYISWLAGNRNENDFVQRRARLVADDAGIEYDA